MENLLVELLKFFTLMERFLELRGATRNIEGSTPEPGKWVEEALFTSYHNEGHLGVALKPPAEGTSDILLAVGE